MNAFIFIRDFSKSASGERRLFSVECDINSFSALASLKDARTMNKDYTIESIVFHPTDGFPQNVPEAHCANLSDFIDLIEGVWFKNNQDRWGLNLKQTE